MKSKKNGWLIGVGIAAVIAAVILGIRSGSSAVSGIGRILLTAGLIVLAVIIIIVVVVLVIALRSSRQDEKEPTGNRTSTRLAGNGRKTTADEEDLLTSCRRTLGETRVMLARVKDPDIRNAGTDVCKEMERIVAALREDPDDIPKTRQFLKYYIPTMSDILDKYYKLEQNGMADQELKDKMASHLKDILAASDKQYQNLFENDKLDLTVDMEVLEMSCRRDGLLSDSSVKGDESDITLKL